MLFFHLWLYARPDPPAAYPAGATDWPWYSGRLGLILFFVISGFLLYRPWLGAALGRREPPPLATYLRSRAARILPAYYLALAGAMALVWGLGSTPGVRLPDADGLPLFLIFGQNIGHATALTLDPPMWTLCVEVAFYLCLPVTPRCDWSAGACARPRSRLPCWPGAWPGTPGWRRRARPSP